MISLIEANTRWTLYAVAMRNEFTHASDLIGYECFYQYARTIGNVIHVYFPSMPNGTRARTYQNLIVLVREVIKVICI